MRKITKPFDCTGRLLPPLFKIGRVKNGLAVIARRVVSWKGFRELLFSSKIPADIFVLPGGSRQCLSRFGAVPMEPERKKGTAEAEIRAAVVLIGFQKRSQLVMKPLFEQIGRQERAHALIVIRVKLEHLAQMAERFAALIALPEACGQTELRAHIGPGFDKAPKLAREIFKRIAKRLFSCIGSFSVQRELSLGRNFLV